jgi:hypothetical protein
LRGSSRRTSISMRCAQCWGDRSDVDLVFRDASSLGPPRRTAVSLN